MDFSKDSFNWKTMPGWATDLADARFGKSWRSDFWVWWYRIVDDIGVDVQFIGGDYIPEPNAISFRRLGSENYQILLRQDDAEWLYAFRQMIADNKRRLERLLTQQKDNSSN